MPGTVTVSAVPQPAGTVTVSAIGPVQPTTPTLQQVTDKGAVTTDVIVAAGFSGPLTGTASYATSAAHATLADQATQATYATSAGTALVAGTISGSIPETQVTGLPAALAALQTSLQAVQASVATSAQASVVTALQATVTALQATVSTIPTTTPTLSQVVAAGSTTTAAVTVGGLTTNGDINANGGTLRVVGNLTAATITAPAGENLSFCRDDGLATLIISEGGIPEAPYGFSSGNYTSSYGAFLSPYGVPVYLYSNYNTSLQPVAPVVVGAQTTTATGGVIDMALPTTFRSTLSAAGATFSGAVTTGSLTATTPSFGAGATISRPDYAGSVLQLEGPYGVVWQSDAAGDTSQSGSLSAAGATFTGEVYFGVGGPWIVEDYQGGINIETSNGQVNFDSSGNISAAGATFSGPIQTGSGGSISDDGDGGINIVDIGGNVLNWNWYNNLGLNLNNAQIANVVGIILSDGTTLESGSLDLANGGVIVSDNNGGLILGVESGEASIDANGNVSMTGSATIGSFLVLPPLSYSPTNPIEGTIYLNNAHQLKVFLNNQWKTVTVT